MGAAIGGDGKGRASIAMYALALAVVWWVPVVAGLIFVAVAVMWLVPDRRITRVIETRVR